MASVTDYTGGEVFPTGSFPWRALKQIFLLGCLGRSYSPECVEDEFYELRRLGILGSWISTLRSSRKLGKDSSGIHRLVLVWQSQLI
jgi:hypothetical protein